MPTNRLALDFGIEKAEERVKFINQYITRPEFQRNPLTQEELETISNYLLWGKNKDGYNPVQLKEFTIETRNKTWSRDDTESLDALMESPTFNEASLRPPEFRPKVVREVFDRKKALQECPLHLHQIFVDLFKEIDTIDLCINLYELSHNKRKSPPRDSLIKKFTQEEISSYTEQTKKWTQQKYLKMRHLIVEKRREQFTLRDTYITKVNMHCAQEPISEPTNLEFDSEIPVFPLGLINSACAPLIFPNHPIAPSHYSENQIEQMIKFYWINKQKQKPRLHFDFENPNHLYKLIGLQEDLEDQVQSNSIHSNTSPFLDTLQYYVDLTDLTPIQKDILQMKIEKKRNVDIVQEICARHGKKYMVNYISTIFTQKIIPRIIDAVKLHCALIENLSYKENFKKCNMCKKELLICEDNFVHKARSKDGFSNRCKKCEKIERNKGGKNEYIKT